MTVEIDLLILGLGNVLCGDDGLGVMAVHQLEERYDAPQGVRVVDGGTLGLALLPLLHEARAVLMIDAIRCEDAPGAVVRLEGADVSPAVRERLSPHDIGVADLLDAAELLGCSPTKIMLLGLVPNRMDLGIGLSSGVEAGMPALIDSILGEAAALGHVLRPKAQRGVSDGARLWA